jgi:putative transposase
MELPNSEQTSKGTLDWPHSPPHRLAEAGVYFVTARATDQQHLLARDSMRDWFEAKLFELMTEFKWRLEAWCVLSNHYHFVAHSPENSQSAESLSALVQKQHSLTTKELNRLDKTPGRTRLWQNFRETHLTYQRSYLARLNYVHQNAAHHGLVRVGSDWKWCSAKKFKESVTPAWLKTIASFKYDEIAADDGE